LNETVSGQRGVSDLHRQAIADLVHLRRNSGPEITITAVAHGTLVLGITASEAGHDGAAHGLKYRNGWDGQQPDQDWPPKAASNGPV
jgi:hypothetical protein